MSVSRGQLPLFFGTAMYAFEGIGVVLPLENQMRSPMDLRGWNGVLNTSLVIVTALYIGMGFFGYLKYGEEVLGSITLNLPMSSVYALQTTIRNSFSARNYRLLLMNKKSADFFCKFSAGSARWRSYRWRLRSCCPTPSSFTCLWSCSCPCSSPAWPKGTTAWPTWP